MFIVKKKKLHLRYKNKISSRIQKKYDARQQEYYKRIKVLKKVIYLIYKIKFVTKRDEMILITKSN